MIIRIRLGVMFRADCGDSFSIGANSDVREPPFVRRAEQEDDFLRTDVCNPQRVAPELV